MVNMASIGTMLPGMDAETNDSMLNQLYALTLTKCAKEQTTKVRSRVCQCDVVLIPAFPFRRGYRVPLSLGIILLLLHHQAMVTKSSVNNAPLGNS